MSNDPGDCDVCGEDARNGWLVPTGRIDEEFNAPIVKVACSEECKDKLLEEVA